MAENNVPISIVEKLISTTIELTKQVTNMPYTITQSMESDIDKVGLALSKIADNLNTPPRNEELEASLDEIKIIVNEIKDSIRGVLKTIKIAASLFGLAILIASIVMYFGSIYISKNNDHELLQELKEVKELVEKKDNNQR